ncbi:MAG: imidazoleglycerol-phosphate dehydratase HisB [Thermoleophilia bacterium]|nr:imidazoleglycerol-phosphate dehydratase HisB [Thermoleophilia bacterium]
MNRSASITRATGETDVMVEVNLDGAGDSSISTGVGFFDHMLTLLARHSLIDLDVTVKGDLETGSHHTVEDTGIAIGQAIHSALGDRSGIERYGAALVPMDECLAEAAIDISGRPLAVVDVDVPPGNIGGFETDLLEEFMRSLASHGRLTLHLTLRNGGNPHHEIEVCFKAVARALRVAVSHNPRVTGIPSTKGSL